ncbi:T9SS type B sorting domain-containing protein [Moheibacter stercoris]|uniref:Gliding motility-associated-like protein n=1 Tax=Moheibacter stercoris TaxID=1628251 RepID=A0ABV2LTZ1_9FLAO
MRFSFNRIFIILNFFLANLQAQSILVNPASSPNSNLSAEELTNEVLIDGGVCSEISNFELFDNPGAQFPNANRSWGYFERGTSDFPFEKGIILTSGYARNSVGPSNGTNSDGSWGGDQDLVVLSGGFPSNDATIFEFDFVPFGNEISFNYIFASEEYPDWTCGTFNDVFGFIISGPGIVNDPGLSGKNIALLPNGEPVTINNVNDDGCGDNTFYVGGPFQDIAFGGRTTPLTAFAEVQAGETYHIRLVISDISDNQWDSAVFLEAGSFNLGGTMVDLEGAELGESKVLCDVTSFPLIINLEAENVTYQWYFNDVEIPGAINASYNATETGNYKVVFIANSCNGEKDIDLTFSSSPETEDPEEDYVCTVDGSHVFNLEDYLPEITADFASLSFQLYSTELGAQTQDDNELILNHQNFPVNLGDGIVTVYVRVFNEHGCFEIARISLEVGLGPETQPLPYAICDDDGDGVQTFDLVSFVPNLVTSDPAGLVYEYYLDSAGTELIPNPGSFQNTTNPQIVYVQIYDPSVGENACISLEELTLQVDEFPALQPLILEICDNENDQSEFIDLTSLDFTNNSPINVTYEYFNGIGGALITNPTNFEITSSPLVIQVKVKNEMGNCEDFTTLTIQFLDAPLLVEDIVIVEECSLSDFATFNLGYANAQLVADITGLIFSYHLTEADARSNSGALPINFTNTEVNQIIFVRVENENGCFEIGRIELKTVLIHNELSTATSVCDDPYQPNDGIANFDLTLRHGEIENSLGANGYTIFYFETLEDALSGNNAIPNPTNYQNITSPQTIYARAETNSGACGGIVDFEIEVLEVPEFELDENAYFCNTDIEKIFQFFGNFESYKWTDQDGNVVSTTSQIEFLAEGTYTLEVTETGLSCPAKRDIHVIFDNQPTITNISVEGNTVTIFANGGYAPYQYSYNNGLTWHDHYILNNVPGGIHELLVRSKYGCISEAKVFGVLGIPNFISPNGDGINDYWEIRGLEVHPDAHIQIFDRYGKLFVDRKIDAGFRWDGKYLGNPIPSGDYWYIITISDGKKVSGHISVRNQ